jgi:hypothetical protein
MKPRSVVLCWAVLGFAASFASTTDADTYARVCVTTVDADSKEAVLAEDSSPSPGKKLIVHLDASTECTALIVPLMEKGSRLANAWRPQIVVLPEWDERTLPDARAAWEWNKTGEPFELWIFFFKRDAAGLDEMQKLVAAMQTSKADERVLTQQTRVLCDKLSDRMRGKQQIMQGPKAVAALVGGSVRSTEFPWRNYAEKVSLNDALEGTLVLRHAR